MNPRVSVVMPAYNAERHITEAIESILGQTLSELELIVVDDASTDGTFEAAAAAAGKDRRVRILRNMSNLGPYPSANVALEQAKSPVVARMDADDISEPTRLEQEVGFLETHPDHIIVGAGYRSIDAEGRVRFERRNPMADSSLRWTTRFRKPMTHFSFRAKYADGEPVRFDESTPTAQDYGLVANLLRRGKGAMLPPALVRYRMHPANISMTRRREQDRTAIVISLGFLEDECGEQVSERFRPLVETLYREREPDRATFVESVRAMDDLIAADASEDRAKKRWMRRRAAGILAEAFIPGEHVGDRLRRAGTFVAGGSRYLGPLGMRAMELRGLIDPLPGP